MSVACVVRPQGESRVNVAAVSCDHVVKLCREGGESGERPVSRGSGPVYEAVERISPLASDAVLVRQSAPRPTQSPIERVREF